MNPGLVSFVLCFWGSVQNEAFCLTLARRMKIPTPSVTTGQAGKRTYLLIKRFDRTEVSGRWRRLHQEDYCQALGNSRRLIELTEFKGDRGTKSKPIPGPHL